MLFDCFRMGIEAQGPLSIRRRTNGALIINERYLTIYDKVFALG